MAANTRLTDLTDYQSVLPYASEIFGVYQPMIGWKSDRKMKWIQDAVFWESASLLPRLGRSFVSMAAVRFDDGGAVTASNLEPAGLAGARFNDHNSVILQHIQAQLESTGEVPSNAGEWERFINDRTLTHVLQSDVLEHYGKLSADASARIAQTPRREHETEQEFELRKLRLTDDAHREIRSAVQNEAVIAGVLRLLVAKNRGSEVTSLLYTSPRGKPEADFDAALKKTAIDSEDPFLTFDPKKAVKDVSLSPIGIVHLFRQYFFELDTFLGTPVGHVWLSPGAQVELIEVSTRKTITEKTVEQQLETIVKTEKSTTDQDELSEAVKQDNRNDLKLGATVTVNQSWGSGNLSATASLNMDRTEQTARETTHKKMRQQTEKLSSEIRENYKSTFKTITEITDTSSKRYTLNNVTKKLLNYELRRKMRQVAVQVQDIGSYLCWETFVDDPGENLGLANLVHVAQPPDLLPVPNITKIEYPADRVVTFRANASWAATGGSHTGFVHLTSIDPPPVPEGFEVVREDGILQLTQISVTGEDLSEYASTFGSWDFGGQFLPTGQIDIGVIVPDGESLSWDDRLEFALGGAIRCTMTKAKKQEIDDANAAKLKALDAATLENERKTKEAFVKSAQERIEFAAGITRRTYEDLREEERIVVYRRLIASLMSSYQYQYADDRSRHVLSELINSIFDIDKMLYFVAPEWWKPRKRTNQYLTVEDLQSKLNDTVVGWSDYRPRPDNYLITEKSAAARLGSSLGWLLQLDGDNLRNAFLNASWVKAVIPVRPGQERAAMAWLQNVNVEGSEGLGPDDYYAPSGPDATKELEHIRLNLGLAAGEPVTLRNALDSLCIDVARKHEEENSTKRFPDDPEINDDNKVTSTPVEKVYEHGFYPLTGGFRVKPGGDFEVFDQWIEVLPTDQVVPVEVAYDPKTGRLL